MTEGAEPYIAGRFDTPTESIKSGGPPRYVEQQIAWQREVDRRLDEVDRSLAHLERLLRCPHGLC